MLEKLQNSLKYLSVVSLSLGLYSHLKNLNKITSELFNERNKLDILNKKYEDLLKNKINENEMEKIISNEKIKLLMEDMNLLKSKLTNQNSINESKLENLYVSFHVIDLNMLRESIPVLKIALVI